MAISSLKKLGFSRSSLIKVKNMFSRNDYKRIGCFLGFLDSLTYAYITLFKVLRFYTSIKKLRISLGYGVAYNELDNEDEILIRIIKFLREKRKEVVIFHTFHSFYETVANFVTTLVMITREFKQFIYSSLTTATRNLNRNLMLDMYNCDVLYFKNKMIPSIDLIMDHLMNVCEKSFQLDAYLIDINTMIINDSSQKIKKIIGLNLPLVKSLLSNDISIAFFHVQRNEISLKFLQIDELSERMLCDETSFGSVLVTIESFQKIIIADSLFIFKKMAILFTCLINTTQSSMEFFFKLSTFLEIKLGKPLTELKQIYDSSPQIQEIPRSLSIEMSVILTLASEMLAECIAFSEFSSYKHFIETIQFKIQVINTTFQHIDKILQATEMVNDLDRTDKFQDRFKIAIDSLSCGALGFGNSIDNLVKPLEHCLK